MDVGRMRIGKTYRVGVHGATVTWRDGSRSTYAAHTLIVLDRLPLRIEGRLFRVDRRGIGYEAPALKPIA